MLYSNTLPLSELAQQWSETEIRPEVWDWHYPGLKIKDSPQFPVETRRRPMPEDCRAAYEYLVTWLINESAFDQLYRQPQVSHIEYQQVCDWCLTTEREDGTLEVPTPLSPIDLPLPLDQCGWFGLNWSRYPQFILESFQKAKWPFNISSAWTDPRHPEYDWFEGCRKIAERFEQARQERAAFKNRDFIPRLTTPQEVTHVAPIATGNPHRDMLNELMRD